MRGHDWDSCKSLFWWVADSTKCLGILCSAPSSKPQPTLSSFNKWIYRVVTVSELKLRWVQNEWVVIRSKHLTQSPSSPNGCYVICCSKLTWIGAIGAHFLQRSKSLDQNDLSSNRMKMKVIGIFWNHGLKLKGPTCITSPTGNT